ncbi:MAG: hypothetical protein IRY83_13000, partial [Chloroflexi bacterium]|nr:hypothetical protein [Chloroflexota bacterium]
MARAARAAPPSGEAAGLHGPGGLGRIFGALHSSPYYRTYWFGNQASLLVNQMQGVAMGYLAYELTRSAAIL